MAHTQSSPPRTPDERQPDTSTIVILVANGRTDVAKLMLQSIKAFEGSLPTSTLKGLLVWYTSSSVAVPDRRRALLAVQPDEQEVKLAHLENFRDLQMWALALARAALSG